MTDVSVSAADEPTNHLDLEAIDGLAEAINRYDGGLVLVSHDFRLIDAVAKEIWVCDHKTVTVWKGDIRSYKRDLAKKMGCVPSRCFRSVFTHARYAFRFSQHREHLSARDAATLLERATLRARRRSVCAASFGKPRHVYASRRHCITTGPAHTAPPPLRHRRAALARRAAVAAAAPLPRTARTA